MKLEHLPAPGPSPRLRRSFALDVVVAGGVAGLLGGVVMALLAMVVTSAFPPHQAWSSARWAAGVFFRHQAAGAMPAWAPALGVLLHLAVSGGAGTTFALLLPRGGTGLAALAWGILFGMACWLGLGVLLVPIASPALHGAANPAVLFTLNVAFGACLGVVAPLRAVFARVEALRLRLGALVRSA